MPGNTNIKNMSYSNSYTNTLAVIPQLYLTTLPVIYNIFINKPKLLQKFSTSLQNRRHFSLQNDTIRISAIYNERTITTKLKTDSSALKTEIIHKIIFHKSLANYENPTVVG